eukprot:m.79222 g.79222  ORF g.79222 m.79222 type:complete len:547 (-) comp19276_c0_seq1:259-1899(-)
MGLVSLTVALAAVTVALPAPRADLWLPRGIATGNTTVTVQIKHSDAVLDALHQTFVAVSTPGTPSYGEHLSFDELNELVRVPENVAAAATAWCDVHGFACAFVGTGDILRVTGSAVEIGSVLNVELESFEHPTSGARIVRTRGVVYPSAEMSEWADCLMGLNTFPTLTRAANPTTNAAPAITPALLKGETLYNITDVASADSKSSMAVAEFQGQGFLPADLAQFESKFGLPSQPVRKVAGDPSGDKSAGTEAELDIQYIIATGTGVPADFYLQPGQAFDLPGWAAAVLADPASALVWSVSYGEGINGGVGGVIQPAYAKALNIQFEKFGTRGMSVLIASGDSGVYNREPFQLEHFHPSFPACCPAATAVGSTQLTAEGVEDSAVSFSGGGFTPTEYFTRAANASWQSAAVAAYLASTVEFPPQKLWDRDGRGIPDVSTVGVDFTIIASGQAQGVSGTSASTPTFAGIIALVNDKLMAAGKKPLGFLNPFLYGNPGMFRDITKGYNNGGGGLFKKGFYATRGWDPLTGLGTPNYPAMKAAALAAAGL